MRDYSSLSSPRVYIVWINAVFHLICIAKAYFKLKLRVICSFRRKSVRFLLGNNILTVLAVDKLQPGVKAFQNNWSKLSI